MKEEPVGPRPSPSILPPSLPCRCGLGAVAPLNVGMDRDVVRDAAGFAEGFEGGGEVCDAAPGHMQRRRLEEDIVVFVGEVPVRSVSTLAS